MSRVPFLVTLAVLAAFAAGFAAVRAPTGQERATTETTTTGSGTTTTAEPAPPSPGLSRPRVRWRNSRAIGLPHDGRLVTGVQLPAEGTHFFTWDFVRKRAPNRAWRRWGTDGLVRITLRVIQEFSAAHPEAPRIGIGDLSRPHGGDFGRRFGGIGHVSHQNGLDVDVYYPRRDGRERAPRTVAQVDRRLAQDLVDRFVVAGAVKVFVGPSLGLRGPPRIVQELRHHDNHLHVRIPRMRA